MSFTTALATFPASVLNLIGERDRKLMRRVHRWHAPRWVRAVMVGASRAGDGWLWYALGFIILMFGGHSRFAATGAGALASIAGIATYLIVKKAANRKRPCAIEPHCWARMLPPDQYSFPSGHTIVAFSIATSVGLFYPQLLVLLFCIALLIAVSRVVLGMHFLSDVVVGVLMGVSLGFAAFLYLRRI